MLFRSCEGFLVVFWGLMGVGGYTDCCLRAGVSCVLYRVDAACIWAGSSRCVIAHTKGSKKVSTTAIKKSVKRTPKKSTKKAGKKVVKKAGKRVAKKVGKKAGKKVAKKSVKKAAKKRVSKKTAGRKVVKKAAKKAAKKVVKKGAKKGTKKAGAKTGSKRHAGAVRKSTARKSGKKIARKSGGEAKRVIKGQMVYSFGVKTEGDTSMKTLLGGKGANLADMTSIGLPVPPGFTITTDTCAAYYTSKKRLPKGLMEEVGKHMRSLERQRGKKFGDQKDPLLVSVRSGAAVSMPGMMDTILNLGLKIGRAHV